ncbi:MAG: pirin family protein [Pleomorphochaeta sp.]
MRRKVDKIVKGYNTVDGDNVHLTRVLSKNTYNDFDPILLLDSFDSENYEEYKNGFPFHPHRGIITITYIDKGVMIHNDSLKNKDELSNGDIQIMVSGSGIYHQEKFKKSKYLKGVQFWINLPKKYKMVNPFYKKIKKQEIKKIFFEGGELKLLLGNYKNYSTNINIYHPIDLYQITLNKDKMFNLKVDENKMVVAFILSGNISVEEDKISKRSAVLFTEGDELNIKTDTNKSKFLLLISEKQNEKIAWKGSIVMNKEEELNQAFKDIENNTFIKANLDN